MQTYFTLLLLSLLALVPVAKVGSTEIASLQPPISEKTTASDGNICDDECSDRGSGRRSYSYQESSLEKERGSGRREVDTPAPKKLLQT
ncbi:hypothetical protein PN462_11395 [Spirulina sp. CS-785/01]|uniref:hypothetical protein n=1 Tax=Spirulina sp. CS-785/01 TaxID=3021716 RepID=UPI002330E729|nr:hypothetical protein [Spirulina sp. CS-785/01]MDB9313705.1 hypothetical protein [Spirulina sp. CS-785/01]